MPRFTTAAALALGLAASATAQSASASSSSGSVVSIFLLDEDPQTLVASLVGVSNSLTTLAVQCAPTVDAADCGYPTPITVTAGASTVHASASLSGVQAEYGCDITASTTGACSITYIGAVSDLATDESQSTATGVTTVSTSGAISAADITYYPITVTAGWGVSAATATSTRSSSTHSGSTVVASNGTAVSTHSSGNSTATAKTTSVKSSVSSAISSASRVASSASSALSSATHSTSTAVSSLSGAANVIAPGAFAAFVFGLAAML